MISLAVVKRAYFFSAWVLIQMFLLGQTLPAYAAQSLRVGQTESKSGLEELEKQLKPAGWEEPRTLPEAINRWFKADAAAQEERALEDWLAARGEERIRRFVERVIDRVKGLANLQQFGAFEVPAFGPAAIPAPGQRSGNYPIPSSTEEFERERVRMMAHVAVRRAFGHLRGKPIRVVANVGIGYVGTAVAIVTADADRYVTIAYQRPSRDSSQKVNLVNEGKMPVRTSDVTAPARLKAAVERGDLTATFLIESLAVADLIMLETELRFRKYHPKQIDQGESDPEASLQLIRQVGSVMQPHATLLIESTVPPGFVEQEAWPALTETLHSAQARRPGLPVLPADRQANVAYAFQRLEPGPRWLQSLMEYKRIGAALTPQAREALEEYFRSVGFQSWEIWSNPSAVAALKDLENAYRVGLIEITGGFLRGLEKLHADAWRIFAEIASDRPETHGSIRFVPAIQEGQGYCCPKELGEFIAGLKRNYGVSDLQIKQILSTRIDAIAVSDFRAEDYAYWLMGALDDAGLSLRDSSILVAGASYKPGVGDTRWTGAERLIRRLAHQGANVLATDPYVQYWPEFHGQQILDPESWAFHLNHQEALRNLRLATVPQLAEAVGPQVHGIVLATRHWQYVGRHQLAFLRGLDLTHPVHRVFHQMFEGIDSLPADEQGLDAAELSARRMGVPGGVIVDTFNFLHDDDIKEFLALGWRVLGSGKGHIPLLAGEVTPADRLRAHQRLVTALQALHKALGIDEGDRRAALKAAHAKAVLFQAQVSAARVEETDLAQARASLTEAANALRHAVPAQRPVLEAQVDLAQAQIRHLEATARTQKEKLAEEEVVDDAELRLRQALSTRQQRVVETTVADVVDPTLRVVAALAQSGGAELNALGKAGLPFLRHPASTREAAEIAEALAKLGDQVQGLRFYVDALVEALLAPEGKARMWQEMARLRARSELAVPTPRIDLSGKVLLPDTIPVLPGTYPVGDENGALYYARGPDNRLHRVDRRPWNATDYNALTLKVVPDMASDPAGMPQAWGRVSVTSPLYLTPVVAPDGSDVIHGFEAYPGAFDQLPPEFRRWFLQDALGRGFAPTTMDGEPQSAVGLVMQVNLQTTTPARGRGGVWFDTASRQPFMYTADGFEWLLDIKALGPYGGGNPVALEYNEDRVVSGGREGAGKMAQSRLGQLIGFQQDWSEIHNLWMLRGTEAWEKGWVSRPVFILRFRFAGNPQHALAMVARGVPTNERLGQSHIGQPATVSNRIGWNTAEILLYPQSAVHIALTADNIMSNGYATDMGSLIWLHNERDPRGALNKYGGFSMQIPLFTFQEIKANDFSNPRGQFLIPWIQGFRERFLESRVGRERVRNPEQFAAILNPANPLLTQDPNKAIDVLMETLWRHYLPWQLLKERLEFGYGPTRESTYSQTSGTAYLPRLQPQLIRTREGEEWAVVGPVELASMQKRRKMTVALRTSGERTTVTEAQFKQITGRSTAWVRNLPYQRAKRFIADQRELLTLARRLIQGEGYAKLDFDFARAFQVLGRKEKAIQRGLDSYADAYDLSEIYPAVKPSVIPVISNLDEMARGSQPVRTTMTQMAPSVMADKAGVEFLVAGQSATRASKSGLEEQATFSLDQWQRIILNSDGSGLREAVEKLVKPHRVDGELKRVRRLAQEAVKKKMFDTDRPVVLIRSPGRARIKMGHPDLPGIGAFSLDAATYQAIWMLAQLTDDGRVIADNLDPEYRKLEFDMDAEDALPRNADAITDPRPSWYEWAMAHQFSDRWEGLVKGSLAFVRTWYLDPAKTRREALRGKGFRLLLADTDLPSGKGFSVSSALPAGIGLALNALFEKESPEAVLSMKDLTQLDYAAYLSGDLAGMADISAILFGELGQATVLWYDPDRIGKRVTLPEDFRIFAVDSGVDRLDEPHQPDDLKNYAKVVKKLSNVAVRLAVLWMRAMSRENPEELGRLEALLTENHSTGVVRELTESGAITQKKYAGMVGGRERPTAVGRGAREKRERFVHQILAQIPNDWMLGQIVAKLRKDLPELRDQINAIAREVEPLGAHKVPKRAKDRTARLQRMRMKTPIPMRQMSWYGIRELERGLKYLDAAKAGDVETMLQMMREAHNGDRALYDPRQGMLAGIPVLTSWGRSGPVEAYQRSLVEIDEEIDQFETAMGSKAAARIGGAGLGGLIMVGQRAPAYNQSKRWWTGRGHNVIEVEPSAGVRVIRLPKVSAVVAKTGLEENQYEVDGTDVRILKTIRLRAGVRAEVLTLPNGSTIEAKSKGAVQIAPGTLIQSGVKVVAPAGKTVKVLGEGTVLQTGAVIDGQVWVGRNVKVDAQLRGQTWVDHNTTFTPGSQTVVEDSILAQRGGRPVSVKQSTGITNSVLWGSRAFQDAVVTDSIMDFAVAGNHTFQSRSRLAGVSAQNQASAAHFNYLISMFMLPLAVWRDLSDTAQREEAYLDLAALRYGTLVRSAPKSQSVTDHASRPLEELTLSHNDQQRVVLTRASNLGAQFGTSNFKARELGGTKGPTLFWGGTMAGVGSYSTAPAESAPNSTLANNAGLAGQVTVPGTLIVPEAAAVGAGIKEGRMDAREGRLGAGVLENVAVRLQVMRALEILARVAAEGVSRAQSPAQRAGYRKEVELLGKFHAETIADLRTYLAVVKQSALNLQKDLEQSRDLKTAGALKEQRNALGIEEPMYQVTAATQEAASYAERIADSSAVVRQAAEAVSEPPRYPMGEIVRFENPDGVFELIPGSPAMSGAVISDGQQKVRNRHVLGIIFAAGKGGRFKDSVAAKSPEYGQRAVELDRADTDGDVIKFAAPVGVSNFPAVLRQLEAFAELGFRSRQPFEVALVDSAGNREMLVRLLEEDRQNAKPRVRWEFLNFVGARPDGTLVLVNGGTLQEVDPATGKPIPRTGTQHSRLPLVDQDEGLPTTYAADVMVGDVQHKKGELVLQWNPASRQRDLPYRVPSGEYGALMAGVNAARAAGINVARRDLLPTYGDQVELYSDPDRLAALLGNVDRADVTGVSIPHRLVNEQDSATGRPQWDPDGGVITRVVWPDGETAAVIAERGVRDPARAADRIHNAKLDEQEVALAKSSGVGYPYNAAPPVFSASFVGDLLSARVDIRYQRKERQIQVGPNSADKQTVPIQVTELEMTQLMQIASQQGRAVQVARVPREARQALKGADDVPPANGQISRTGRERLQRLLGIRLQGNPAHIEIAPSARSFFATGDGSLKVIGNVGIEIDRWGVWVREYEGESPFAGGSGIPRFSRGRRLAIPATSDGVIPLDHPVVIDEQTFNSLSTQSGLEERAGSLEPSRRKEATDADRALIQSFSGIRAVVGGDIPPPVAATPADTQLSPENELIFGRYGYQFGLHQIKKFQQVRAEKKNFLFVTARDPRPSGRAVMKAQMRGILLAARELGVEVTFRDGGVAPTPFAEGMVRMLHADGGVISTASHNPLLWNGVKYPTAAVEPTDALVQAGILLPAGQMREVADGFKAWARQVAEDVSIGDAFLSRLRAVDLSGAVQPVDRPVVLDHMIGEGRKMWGLTNEAVFQAFRGKAAKVRMVVDPNGGAASWYYAEFLRAFGFQVKEINSAPGRPQHLLEPIEDKKNPEDRRRSALMDAKNALAEEGADIALILDYDADRGNTLIRDRRTGEIIEPNPQAVAAMNIAIVLARAQNLRAESRDRRSLAVVVHDAPSGRQQEIAKIFGAQPVVVEVGEVNVLGKMRHLEREGYHVPVGAEVANGGTVYRGDDAVFQGDTSRNGAMTALVLGIAAVDPQIGRTLLTERNARKPADVPAVSVPETPTLLDILKSLPGEQGQGGWRFVTLLEKLGARGDVPENRVIPFKQALEDLWNDFWKTEVSSKGFPLADGTRQPFTTFRIKHHVETEESPAYGPAEAPGAGLAVYGQGGWILELDTPDGRHAWLWTRGSLTEGMVRASAEGQGKNAEAVAKALMALMKQWYPQALESSQKSAAAGLEEGIGADDGDSTVDWTPDVPVSESFIRTPSGVTHGSWVILTPETARVGLEALSAIRPPAGEPPLSIAVIARNAAQKAQITAGLEEAGLALAMPILTLEGSGQTLAEAIVGVQVEAWSRGLETFVIETLAQLKGIAQFLRFIPASVHAWTDWIERLTAGVSA